MTTKQKAWGLLHNCVVHPVMGLLSIVNLDVQWVDDLHDYTGKKAFEEKKKEPVNDKEQ